MNKDNKIEEYRDRYFRQAVSTEPADRPRAEAAARKMAEIADVEINSVKWINSPKQGASLRDSLRDSLRASLRDSIWDSLRDSLRDSIWESLWGSLSDSLWESLRVSLGGSLSDSLWKSIKNSIRDSLWDTGWLAFYSFCAEELKIKIDDSTHEKLRLHNEIAASCFALWIVPGTIILCERPSRIKIIDGNVIDIEFDKTHG